MSNKEKTMKYNEDQIIEELYRYIKSTYTEHYSTTGEGFQVMDILTNLAIDRDFCQANAIKYLMRYGKKQGYNEQDLFKALHYIVLLISSQRKETSKNNTTTGKLYARGETTKSSDQHTSGNGMPRGYE